MNQTLNYTQANNIINSLHNSKYDNMIEKNYKEKCNFLKMMHLINRLIRDEWDIFLYSKFDENGNNNAYRLGIKEEIKDLFKKTRNQFRSIGYEEFFEKFDNRASDMADEMQDVLDVIHARIKTSLTNKIQYCYIEPLTHMIVTFLFCVMGKSLMKNTNVNYYYENLINQIDEYSDRIGIEIYNGIESIRDICDDEIADMLIGKMFKMIGIVYDKNNSN